MNRRELAIGLAALPASGAARAASPPAGQGALDALWRAASDGSIPATGRADALLLQRDGRTLFEAYGAGDTADTRHVSWSMAKSITQALVGIAVADGRVSLDAPLRRVPRLTLRQLLTMTDGLKWDENGYDVVTSDATRMLYGPGRLDGAAYTAAKPQATPPGAHWRYSTGALQLAAAELQDRLFPEAKTPAARRDAFAPWIRSRLFQPLGMTRAVAEFDPAGTFYGGSLVYASARDYARFGRLYLDDGVADGKRLLPQGWVSFARTPTRSPRYGAGWWLETVTRGKGRSLLGGRGPLDAFSAQGHAGQVILVVPSKRLVVVRLSLMPDEDKNWAALGDWMAQVVAAV